jgi:hypothetical protein
MNEGRIDRLEAGLARIEQAIFRIEGRLVATLPYLATESELADKPSRHYNWSVRAAMTAAYIAGLGAGSGGRDVIDVPAVSLSDK